MSLILAVDDMRLLRNMLSDCLRAAGHEVVEAENGADALAQLKAHRPDMVITDLNMPVMDGLDFIENARREPEGASLPMLLLTTETAHELKERAREVCATGWIAKPFDPEQIIGLVERLT